MKSFFKKLAFVMALAMVVSMAAPAAQKAVAAEDKALAIAYQKGAVITALNLAEVGATEDLRFVYAPENWKELDVVWTSSNPNVVAVDQNGVVEAKAAGTATVTVAVGTETASIDVYSVDMKAFDVTIGTAEERALTEKTVKVGDAVDFKFFGVKDYDVNYYNCVWGYAEVIGEDVVEFDAARGDIVAKNPGKVIVTLTVINKLTLASIKVQNVEVTVESETPVVDNSFAVKQLNSDTVEVTFAKKDITDKEISFKATSVYGEVKNDDEYISVSAVKDGVVTVKFYNGLNAGYKYTLTNNNETVEFAASNGIVDRIVIGYNCCNTANTAYAGQTVNITAKVYSGDVEVTASNGVTFKYVSSLFGSESVGTSFYGVQAGEVVTVTATYYNTGASEPVVATIAIPVQAAPEYKMKTSNAEMGIAYAENVSYQWWMGNKISTSDVNQYMVFKTEDVLGATIWGDTDATKTFYSNQYGIFRFTTTNDTVLGVSESNGALYPRSAGSALIQAWFVNSATGTKTLVGSKQVTVYGPRVLNAFTLAKTYSNNMSSTSAQTYASVANVAGADTYNQVTFQFNTKDQLGDKMTADLWATFNNNDDNGSVTFAYNNGTNGTAKFIITANDVFGADVRTAYKDVELTLHAKNSVEFTQQVVVRIFNVNYEYRVRTQQAFVHTDSTGDLGVIRNKTAARYLYAGVVDFENNAYHTSDNLVGVIGAWDVPTSIRNIVNNANIAKATITNAQNITPAQQAAIASATALVNNGWYYEVIVDGWNDVSANATIVNKNTSNEVLEYQVRAAAASLTSHYDTDLSNNWAHTYDANGNITACPADCAAVTGDVFDNTRWGQTVTFTFYQVKYNQYTSRFEYDTKTVTKTLTNSDRATVGGTAEVQTNRVVGSQAGVASLNDFVKKYIHVTVYDRELDKTITLCDKADCYKTAWGAGDGVHFSLRDVVTNGEGVYTGNIYVDSQTVNNWAYIVSLLVTYNDGNGEVVTVEIPVNTRVEW